MSIDIYEILYLYYIKKKIQVFELELDSHFIIICL